MILTSPSKSISAFTYVFIDKFAKLNIYFLYFENLFYYYYIIK